MTQRGQSTIEFTFTLVVIFFLAYGMVRVLRWAGMDMAERRWAHEQVLFNGSTPREQLKPDFYRPKRMDMFREKGQ